MSADKGVVATTLTQWLKNESVKASLNNNPFLYNLWEVGNIKFSDFSDETRITTQFASDFASATDSSGTGMVTSSNRVTDVSITDFMTVPKKQLITKNMMDVEKSKFKQISYFLNELEAGQNSILNTIEGMAFGDGTTDSGYALDGLGAMISKTPDLTIFGGINPATQNQWQNLAINGLDPANVLASNPLTEPGQPMSITNILARIKTIINKLSLNGASPSHIFLPSGWYDLFEEAVEGKERLNYPAEKKDVKIGFRQMYYKGLKVVNAGGLKRKTSTTYAGLAEDTMYILDLNDICLFAHKIYDAKTKELGLKEEDIQAMVYIESGDGLVLRQDPSLLDYHVKMVFKGNFNLGDRQRHAVYYEEVIAP